MRRLRHAVLLALVLSPLAAAQGTVQATFLGVPPALPAPFVSELARDVEAGRYPLQLLYSAPTAAPVEVRLRLAIEVDGRLLAEAESLPFALAPGVTTLPLLGPEVVFETPLETLLMSAPGADGETIRQTGALPEGTYRLTAEAVPEDPTRLVTSVPGVAVFFVRYARPPVPVTPPERATVAQEAPVFAWTSVAGAPGADVVYEFRLVDVRPLQTPLDAVQANRPWAQVTLTGTSLAYRPDLAPPTAVGGADDVLPQALRPGQLYAWQVAARDEAQRTAIAEDGLSEIRTFRYDPAVVPGGSWADLDALDLVPGVARLVGLGLALQRGDLALQVGEFSSTLSGLSEVELTLPRGTVRVPVEVDGIELQRVGAEPPVLLEGSLDGRLTSAALAALGADALRLRDLAWSFADGLVLRDPAIVLGGREIRAEGTLRLTTDGLAGTLTADDPAGLVTLGDDPVSLRLTRVEASFPSGQVDLDGSLAVFDAPTTCAVSGLQLTAGQLTGQVACDDPATLRLGSGSAGFEIALHALAGTVSADLATGAFTPALQAGGRLDLIGTAGTCGATLGLDFTASGVAVRDLAPTCPMGGVLSLGSAELALSGLAIPTLAYAPGASWTFDATLDGSIRVPALGLTLPTVAASLSRQGLRFPALAVTEAQLALPSVDLGGFGFDLTSVALDPFTFPLLAWDPADAAAPDPWDFRLGGRLRLPPGPELPACLRGPDLALADVGFTGGELALALPYTALQNCRAELPGGTALVLSALTGSLRATASASGLSLAESSVSVQGQAELGAPFACADGARQPTPPFQLAVGADGLLTGELKAVASSCPTPVGPFGLQVTDATLRFAPDGGVQGATLDGRALITLAPNETATGTVGVDLRKGELTALSVALDQPFDWALPSAEAPVMTFRLSSASLGLDGFRVSGPQRLLVDGQPSVSAVFQSVHIPLDSPRIASGRVVIEGAFGLGVTGDASGVAFEVVGADAPPPAAPGARLTIKGPATLDGAGLALSGTADAYVTLGVQDAEAQADFTGFRLGLAPFGVAAGRADFLMDGQRVAYLTSEGLFPDGTLLLAAIPDTLGLPTPDVAYVVLRDAAGTLLVDATPDGAGGFTLATVQPLDLRAPGLAPFVGLTPAAPVTFSGVTVSLANGTPTVTGGEITADLTPDLTLEPFLPYTIRRLTYREGTLHGVPTMGFGTEGDLVLLDEEIGDSGTARLMLSGGHLYGDLDLDGLDHRIELAAGADVTAVLVVDGIEATIDADPAAPQAVAFDVDGDVLVEDAAGAEVLGLALRATLAGSQFTVTHAQPRQDLEGRELHAGPLGVRFGQVHTFDLLLDSRRPEPVAFTLDVDAEMLLDLPQIPGGTVQAAIPLRGVHLTGDGLTIPAQTVTAASQPALAVPAIDLDPVTVEILALRTESAITIPFSFAPLTLSDLNLDLAVHLGALADRLPALSDETLLMNRVGIDDGVFTGTLETYQFGPGLKVPLDPAGSATFELRTAGGQLYAAADGSQAVDVVLTGELGLPPTGFEERADCPATSPIQVALSTEGGLVGATQVAPCARLAFGPASLEFLEDDPANPGTSPSEVRFAFGDGRQSVVFDGVLQARWARANAPDLTTTASAEVDLLTGAIENGVVEFIGPLDLGLPAADPLLAFTVDRVRLEERRLTIDGGGTLALPGNAAPATVQFQAFALDPATFDVVGGRATVAGGAAFEVGLQPLTWGVVAEGHALAASTGARLDLSGGFAVTRRGVVVDGTGLGTLRFAENDFPMVGLAFDSLTVGLATASVADGRVTFNYNGQDVAEIDVNGFSALLEGALLAALPERLPLPTESVAYLALGTDPQTQQARLDVDLAAGTIRTRPGQTVDLVIPALQQNGQDLVVAAQFDVSLDDLGNLSGGTVSLDLTSHPEGYDLAPYLGVPVRLQGVDYAAGALSMALSVDAPDAIGGAPLDGTLAVSASGLQGTLSGGQFSKVRLAQPPAPLSAESFGGGVVEVEVLGFEASFGTSGNAVRLSGQLASSLFRDEAGADAPLHLWAEATSALGGSWAGGVDTGGLAGGRLQLGQASLEPVAQGQGLIDLTFEDAEIAVEVSGILRVEALGDAFALTVDRLRASTAPDAQGRYLTVDAQATVSDQAFSLFGGALDVETSHIGVALTTEAAGLPLLALTLDGEAVVLNARQSFTGLTVRSDGTFALAQGEFTLLQDVPVIPNTLQVDAVKLLVAADVPSLRVEATATLPAPLTASAPMTLTVSREGDVDVEGPLFLFDAAGTPTLGNNPDTEFAIGSFGTLELTALGVDLDLHEPQRSAVRAAAVLYVGNETAADHRLLFGDAAHLAADPGVRVALDGTTDWRVRSPGGALAFDYEYFSFAIAEVRMQTGVDGAAFRLAMSGSAGLNVSGVEGSATWQGLTVSSNGLEDLGGWDGAATLTLADVFSLTVGEFTREDPPGEQTVALAGVARGTVDTGGSTRADGGAGVGTSTVDTDATIDVYSYLQFGDGSQDPALRLTIPDLADGGVDRVLIYELTPGAYSLEIDNAHLALGGSGDAGVSLALSMRYVNSADGFLFEAAGGGTAGPIGFAAAGKMSTSEAGGLRAGLFLAGSVPITIIPGIIEVNSIGGGLFYRPELSDFALVESAIQAIKPGFEQVGPTPDVSDLKFAVFAFAGVSVVGTGSNAVYAGDVLLAVTDQFTKLDMTGYLYGQTGENTPAMLKGGAFVTIAYAPTLKGVEGGFVFEAEVGAALTGGADLTFSAVSRNGGPVTWGIWGGLDASVVEVLDASGSFVIGPDGFLLDASARIGGDLAVVAAEGTADLVVWRRPAAATPFGAWGRLGVSFEVLFGAAEFGASVQGLLVDRRTRWELYLAGEAYIDVLGVYEGDLTGWVRVRTNSLDVDWGTGQNPEMMALIAQARGDAEAFKDQAETTRQEAEAASNELDRALADPALTRLTPNQIRDAGFNLVLDDVRHVYAGAPDEPEVPVGQIAAAVEAAEVAFRKRLVSLGVATRTTTSYGTSIASTFEDGYSASAGVYKSIYQGWTVHSVDAFFDPRPTDAPIPDSTAVRAAIDAAVAEGAAVASRLDAAEAPLQSALDRLAAALDAGDPAAFSVPNPVSNVVAPTPGGDGFLTASLEYTFDATAVAQGEQAIDQYQAELLAQDAAYRDAIRAAAQYAVLVDLVLDGESAIDWGPGATPPEATSVQAGASVDEVGGLYVRALTGLDRLAAEETSALWTLAEWSDRTRPALAAAQLQGLQQPWVFWRTWITNASGTANRQAAIQAVGTLVEARRRGAMLLSGASDAAADAAATASRTQVQTALGNGDYASAGQTFRLSGKEFWFDIPYQGAVLADTTAFLLGNRQAGGYRQPVETARARHATFTAAVDRLYGLKAQLLAGVVGMMDQHAGWRTAMGVVDGPALDVDRTEVLAALTPPTLQTVTLTSRVDPAKRGRFWSAQLRWRPAAGEGAGIAESAVAVVDAGAAAPTVYDDVPYGTVGSANDARYSSAAYAQALGTPTDEPTFSYAERRLDVFRPLARASEPSRDVTAYVRVRGTGGLTASRFVDATLTGTWDDAVTSGVYTGGGGRTFGALDATPPSTPVLDLPGTPSAGRVWLSDSSRVAFAVEAADLETGVSHFDVALGTAPGRDDVDGWHRAEGTRTVVGMGASAVERLATTLYGLDLPAGQTLHLQVRAVNGDGAASPAASASIAFDATAPRGVTLDVRHPDAVVAADGTETTLAPDPAGPPVVLSSTYAVVDDAPDWNPYRRIYGDASTDGDETFKLSWSATDPESGIRSYDFAIASEPGLGAAAFDSTWHESWFGTRYATGAEIATWTTTLGSGYDYLEVPYGAEWVVYVRARNHAGLASGTVESRPLSRTDRTRPTAPGLAVQPTSTGYIVALPVLSTDNETGVVGYQIAVGTAPGLDDLHAWPQGMDLVPNATVLAYANRQSNAYVPPARTGLSGLPDGNHWVSVRAVNGAGLVSRTVTVQARLDTSPPTIPPFEAVRVLDVVAPAVDVMLSDAVSDPQSGLQRLSYVVFAEGSPDDTWLFGTVASPDALKRGQPYRIALPVTNTTLTAPGAKLRVRLKAINGVGNSAFAETEVRPPAGGDTDPPVLPHVRAERDLGQPDRIRVTLSGPATDADSGVQALAVTIRARGTPETEWFTAPLVLGRDPRRPVDILVPASYGAVTDPGADLILRLVATDRAGNAADVEIPVVPR